MTSGLEPNFSSSHRTLVLAATPIILVLALLSGGVAFLAGQGLDEVVKPVEHHAKLPIAKDRFLGNLPNPVGVLSPVVALAADASKTLPPVRTETSGDWIRIPSLDVTVPLSPAKTMSDADVLEALLHGVALYPNGVTPGQVGNTFISGHSTGEPWKGKYRFAFMHLDRLKKGDAILMDYHGTRYTYVVSGSRTVDPKTAPTLSSDTKTPTMTLMACWPLWTTQHRLLVDGKLTAVNSLITQK